MFPCLSLIRQGGVGKEPKRMRMKDAQNDQGRRIRFKIVEKRFRPPPLVLGYAQIGWGK